jgi:agmatine deiminase
LNTPKSLGYYFPAEFAQHDATWLSWPHKEASWPGKIDSIYPAYSLFVKYLAQSERVCINVNDEAMRAFALAQLQKADVDLRQVEFFLHPTNDAWCRDHGPAFLLHHQEPKKAIVDWGYNAWGGKYPPYDLDDVIPTRIAQHVQLPVFYPGIVMEGGSVEFNGKGTLLTSTACLLNISFIRFDCIPVSTLIAGFVTLFSKVGSFLRSSMVLPFQTLFQKSTELLSLA